MSGARRRAVPALVVIVLAVVAGLWFGVLRPDNDADSLFSSGTVEATEARLGFQAAGRIEMMAVREGHRVVAGQLLARLDQQEILARRAQAEAQVAAARALLRELQSGFRSEEIAQARAGRDAAAERLADAERDLQRARVLLEGGAISQEALDKAKVAHEVARSQLEQATEQLRLFESGPRAERIESQRAQLAAAEAALQAIEAAIEYATIEAPFEGVVTIRHSEPGEIVAPGAAVLTITNPDDRWVRIYVREDRIGAVRIGTEASITSDTYADKDYTGEVIFIATEAEFTPKNVQTTKERVKLVFAVKVQITGDEDQDLKPGMPADVRLRLAGS
jgi:HlyD family secretion protein